MVFHCFLIFNIDIFVICERCKRPAEERRRIAQYTSIVSLFSQAMVDHLKYSLSCERFFKLQLYCYCNVLAVKKFVCFKTFFRHESQPAGPAITKTKNVNVE